MTTNKGNIKVELDADKAPKTVANFLDYVNKGHFNNTIFHRVIKDFMIQGGGFEPNMNQKDADQKVENEAKNGLKNDKYTIAMARTMAPHSASAQFYINTKNNEFLNYPGQDGCGYSLFGKDVEGQDIVDQINTVKTSRAGMHSDEPVEPVIIEKVEVVQ
jgi:peptidyl-prolyl cis-trans isomerase B (cyclophilin B)